MEGIKTSEDLLYSSLPPLVEQASKELGLTHSASSDFATTFLSECLPKTRVLQKEHELDPHQAFILDNAVVKKGAAQRCKPPGLRLLNAKELRKARLYAVSKDHKYEDFLPLHHLWLQYMEDVFHFAAHSTFHLESPATQNNLLKADYHGCLITVQKSKCPSYIGVTGIIIQETRNALKIATQNSGVKTIPKRSSVFAFQLGGYQFQLFGNHFMTKPSDRASKKFKAKPTIDL